MKIEGSTITFSSGKRYKSLDGALILNGNSLQGIHFDRLPNAIVERFEVYNYNLHLNKEDAYELADYMIHQWQSFKNSIKDL